MIDFPEFIDLSIPALTNSGHLSFVYLVLHDSSEQLSLELQDTGGAQNLADLLPVRLHPEALGQLRRHGGHRAGQDRVEIHLVFPPDLGEELLRLCGLELLVVRTVKVEAARLQTDLRVGGLQTQSLVIEIPN